MRSKMRLICTVLPAIGLVFSSAGCLSLGGRTTYVQEDTETSARVSALETRVGALEQAFGRPVAASDATAAISVQP